MYFIDIWLKKNVLKYFSKVYYKEWSEVFISLSLCNAQIWIVYLRIIFASFSTFSVGLWSKENEKVKKFAPLIANLEYALVHGSSISTTSKYPIQKHTFTI